MANTHENLNYVNNDMYVVFEWLWTIMTAGACIVLLLIHTVGQLQHKLVFCTQVCERSRYYMHCTIQHNSIQFIINNNKHFRLSTIYSCSNDYYHNRDNQ